MSILEENDIFLDSEDECNEDDDDDDNLRNSRKVDARNFSSRSGRSTKGRLNSANYDGSRKERKVVILMYSNMEFDEPLVLPSSLLLIL